MRTVRPFNLWPGVGFYSIKQVKEILPALYRDILTRDFVSCLMKAC